MAFLILLLIGGVFLALSCSSKLISEAVSLIIVTCFYIFIPDRECKTLGFISQYSFGIYLLHSPLIYITFTYLKDENPLIVIGLNFLVFGAVSLLLSIGISKTPLKILIGMKYTVKKDFSK